MQLNSLVQVQSSTTLVDRKIRLLNVLKELEFSGKAVWQSASNQQWLLFFNMGHLLYATGGRHPIKRLQRILQQQAISSQVSEQLLCQGFSSDRSLALFDHTEYAQIHTCIQAGELPQDAAVSILHQVLEEVILDVFLHQDAKYTIIEEKVLPSLKKEIVLDEEPIFRAAYDISKKWEVLNLGGHFPDQAPIIRNPERIREKTNQPLYDIFITLLDGRNTLRDLSLKMSRDVVQVTQALKSFIQLGWIVLKDIPDMKPLPAPEKPMPLPAPPEAAPSKTPEAAPPADPVDYSTIHPGQNGPTALIACIDDSPMICQSMEKIVKSSGHDFLGILDPLRVLSTLLAKKPDIIFLDLVMPYTNGYEICSRLRKVTVFSNTPIIILSGNDGVVDQVRARLMGATDFVSKPVDPGIILKTIYRYLEQSARTYQAGK